MSAEKCGNTITFDMIQSALEKAAKEGGRPYDRIISYRAGKMLKKIHNKFPNWDNWLTETEIWFKAHKMGLLETDDE